MGDALTNSPLHGFIFAVLEVHLAVEPLLEVSASSRTQQLDGVELGQQLSNFPDGRFFG